LHYTLGGENAEGRWAEVSLGIASPVLIGMDFLVAMGIWKFFGFILRRDSPAYNIIQFLLGSFFESVLSSLSE